MSHQHPSSSRFLAYCGILGLLLALAAPEAQTLMSGVGTHVFVIGIGVYHAGNINITSVGLLEN